MKILVINGPNLNMLGLREPEIYGKLTLDNINGELVDFAKENNVEIDFFQSNHEGEIIDRIHSANESYDGVVINPAAYTHYSHAIGDAIKSVYVPFVELHISNIFVREDFRSKSVTAPACIGVISGFGDYSYKLAILSIINYLKSKKNLEGYNDIG